MKKDYVLVSYRPLKEAEEEAHMIVNDEAVVFLELLAIDGAEMEILIAHKALMKNKEAVDVAVFHYGSLKALLDEMMGLKS